MNTLYNSLRLLGYKINELPNGCFIGKRPDNSQSLFDDKGNVIIGNADTINYKNEYYYCATHKDKVTVYDKYGTAIDEADYYNVVNIGRVIQVKHRDNASNTVYKIYGTDCNAQFTNVNGEIFEVFEGENTLKLVYQERYSSNTYVCYDDSSSIPPNELNLDMNSILTGNRHYLLVVSPEFTEMEVVDYDGNIIVTEGIYYIDTTSIQSSNILELNSEGISLLDCRGDVIHEVNSDIDISKVSFTSEPGIVCIHTRLGDFILMNIYTGEQSKKYSYIDNEHFIGQNINETTTLELIDRKTLKVLDKLDGINKYKIANNSIIVAKQGKEECYTLDFRQLIHEF